MAVLFWYLVKSDASVRYCILEFTEQVTFYKVIKNTRPCITGHPVYKNPFSDVDEVELTPTPSIN